MKKFLTALCCLGFCGTAFAQFNIDGRVQTINNPANLSGSRDNSSPNGTVTNSAVNITGGTLNNFSATGGATIGQAATGNSVSVKGTTGTNVSLVGGDSDSLDTILPSGPAGKNSVNITNSTITNSSALDIIGGRADGNQANGNSVNITNSSVTNKVIYGGYSSLGENFGYPADEEDPLSASFDPTYNYSMASNNSINVLDSTVNAQLIGGFSTDLSTVKSSDTVNAVNSTAENNRVSVINSTIISTTQIPQYNSSVDSPDAVAIIGGNGGVYSNNNSVYVENSQITGQIIGATTRSQWVRSEGDSAIKSTANNNSVWIKGPTSTINGSVFGVNSSRTNASGNVVQVTDGATINGNLSGAKSTYNIIVDAESEETPKPEVLRGVATQHSNNAVIIRGTATEKVTINTATNTEPNYQLTNGFITGSWNEAGNTSGNTVDISNAIINGNGSIIGGFVVNEVQTPAAGSADTEVQMKSIGHTSQNNTVSISDSTVTGKIYGGYVMFKADANAPAEGNEEERAVDRASGNTVKLHNTQVTGNVYGGYSERDQVYVNPDTQAKTFESWANNNTVILSGNTVVTGTIYGGYVGTDEPDTIYRGNKLVLSHYQGTLGELKNFQETFIIGNDSDVTFSPTSQIFATFQLEGKPQVEQKQIAQTSTDSMINMEQSSLGAYEYMLTSEEVGGNLNWILSGGFSQTNAKPYAQAALAGLALTTAGDDTLSQAISTAFEAGDENNTFFGGEYGNKKYKTGSGFNMDTAVAQAGMYHRFTSSTLAGLFAQYAYGDYDTFPKRADGKVNSYAGGAFAAWNYSETGRFEVHGRLGTQNTKFNSEALQSDFKYNKLYWGIGGGFVEDFGSFDVFGKISFARTGDEKKTDNLGQELHFEAMQSLVGKFGANYDLPFMLWGFQPTVGAAGIYEFDGDSKTTLDGYKIDDASLGGLSGEGKISFAYDVSTGMIPMKTALSVFGLAGQTQGWGVNVKVMGRF